MVKNLNVYFKGADLVAYFSELNEDSFDADYFIELHTQSKIGTGIKLLAQMPSPREAFYLNCGQSIGSKKEHSLVSNKLGWFSKPVANDSKTLHDESYDPEQISLNF